MARRAACTATHTPRPPRHGRPTGGHRAAVRHAPRLDLEQPRTRPAAVEYGVFNGRGSVAGGHTPCGVRATPTCHLAPHGPTNTAATSSRRTTTRRGVPAMLNRSVGTGRLEHGREDHRHGQPYPPPAPSTRPGRHRRAH